MKIKDVRLTADKVLVKKNKRIEEVGGIYIPDKHQKKTTEGVVVAVGPGLEFEKGKIVEPAVKKGDRVLVPLLDCVDMKINGEEYGIYREEDILGVYD